MTQNSIRNYKDELFTQFARIGKALASPQRLEFLELLTQCEWSVEALARETGESVANTSRHLQILRSARLVETRRDGVTIYYRLADPTVSQLWYALRDLGALRLAEVDRLVNTYLHDRQSMEALSCSELQSRLHDDSVLVLDVRSAHEYSAGHITGAHSVPLAELEFRLAEFPSTLEIVAYCRGPFCVLADEAVKVLQRSGRRAFRLDGGFVDWRAAGMPVQRALPA